MAMGERQISLRDDEKKKLKEISEPELPAKYVHNTDDMLSPQHTYQLLSAHSVS